MSLTTSWLQAITEPQHASEWISGLTGALGAILGGVVGIGWSVIQDYFTRSRERREKNALAAFSSYQRLNQIYSVSTILRNHLRVGFERAKVSGQPVCTVTQPVQRMCGLVNFPIEELWALTKVGGTTLIDTVNSLDHSFNSLLDSFDNYRAARDEVWRQMPVPDKMDGTVGSIGLTANDLARIGPGIAGLDFILAQTKPISESIVQDTFEALRLLTTAKSKPLGKKFKITLPSPDGKEVTISAVDEVKQRTPGRSRPGVP